jgi:ABC-type Fe3+-citrate transport system substrate-binding protein
MLAVCVCERLVEHGRILNACDAPIDKGDSTLSEGSIQDTRLLQNDRVTGTLARSLGITHDNPMDKYPGPAPTMSRS